MNFPRRWQDRTADHEAAAKAWSDARPMDGRLHYNGNGACWHETVIDAVLQTRFDGNIVFRCHTGEWARINIGAGFRLPTIEHRGQRVIDLSCLMPEAGRTLYVEADDRIPWGRGLVLGDRDVELVVVAF